MDLDNIDKKKLAIFIFALLAFTIVFLYLISQMSFRKPSSPEQNTTTSNPSGPTSSSPNNYFPGNTPSTYQPPTTTQPSSKNGVSVGQNLRNNTSYFYAAARSKEDIKKAIDESFGQKDYPEDINWTSFATKDNEQVSLSDFSNAMGIKINPGFSQLLDEYNYDRITCKNSSGKLEYGLVINFKLFDNYPQLGQEGENILKTWEPTMLKDLYKVLYPNETFTTQDLDQKLAFKNGKYRYTDIVLPGNEKGTINYHMLVDSIVFTNSLECMDKASQAIEAIE